MGTAGHGVYHMNAFRCRHLTWVLYTATLTAIRRFTGLHSSLRILPELLQLGIVCAMLIN